MQSPNFELVRQRFQHACGYCDVTEISTGGLLTIDHYQLRSSGGGDELDNLIYACFKCNQYKHEFWPTDEQLVQQRRVLHPLIDDFSLHFGINEQSGVLEPFSSTGRFHINLLHLNRPQLVKHRLSWQLLTTLQEKNQQLERQIAEIQKAMIAKDDYIVLLQNQNKRFRK